MIEGIMKKIRTKSDYEVDIKETKENIKRIDEMIVVCKENKPMRFFKKKMQRYENEMKDLHRIKNYLEERLDRLDYEKKRLYP